MLFRSSELTDNDFEIKELKNPYGAYRIEYYDSPGYTCGALENEKQLNELKIHLEKDDNIKIIQLSRFVDGEIKVEILIDNGPKSDPAGFSIEDRE